MKLFKVYALKFSSFLCQTTYRQTSQVEKRHTEEDTENEDVYTITHEQDELIVTKKRHLKVFIIYCKKRERGPICFQNENS